MVSPVDRGAVHRQAGGGADGVTRRRADAGTDDEGRVGAGAVEVGAPDLKGPVRPVEEVAVERYALGAEEAREQGEVGAGSIEVGLPDQAVARRGGGAPIDVAPGAVDRNPGGFATERVDDVVVGGATGEGGPSDRVIELVHPVDEAVRAVDGQGGVGAHAGVLDEVGVGGARAVEVGAPDLK